MTSLFKFSLCLVIIGSLTSAQDENDQPLEVIVHSFETCPGGELLPERVEDVEMSYDYDKKLISISGTLFKEEPFPDEILFRVALFKCLTRDYEDCTNKHYDIPFWEFCDILEIVPNNSFVRRFADSIEDRGAYCGTSSGSFAIKNAPLDMTGFIRTFPDISPGFWKVTGTMLSFQEEPLLCCEILMQARKAKKPKKSKHHSKHARIAS